MNVLKNPTLKLIYFCIALLALVILILMSAEDRFYLYFRAWPTTLLLGILLVDSLVRKYAAGPYDYAAAKQGVLFVLLFAPIIYVVLALESGFEARKIVQVFGVLGAVVLGFGYKGVYQHFHKQMNKAHSKTINGKT